MAHSSPTPDARPAGREYGGPLLELIDLHHRWKSNRPPVLDGVSLALSPGTVTWIGGRNGVGKTTLLRLAAGILIPQAGTVRLC